jgi:hypothetical protein
MKLKTKIEHQFGVDPSIMDNFDFSVEMPKVKEKTKIVEVKKRKFKSDVSTRLF